MPKDLASVLTAYPDTTKELNIDGKCSTRDLQALARFTQLQSISISCVGLTSFQGLPTSVQRLVAADNSISSGAVAGVTVAKGLTSLDLAGNRIRTVDALSCLKELKLKALDLSGNPVCETDNYREAVFKMLDELEYLDGKDRLGNERDGDEEEEEEEYDEGEEYEEEAGGNEEGGEAAEEGEGEEEPSEPPSYAALVGEDPLEDDEEEYQEEDEDDDDDEGEEEGEGEEEEEEAEGKGTGQKRKREAEDEGEDEDAEDDDA